MYFLCDILSVNLCWILFDQSAADSAVIVL